MTPNEQFIALQRACGLSNAEAAAVLGIKEDTVSKWRRGARQPGPGHLSEMVALAHDIDRAVACLSGWDPADGDPPGIPEDLAQYEGVRQVVIGRALST